MVDYQLELSKGAGMPESSAPPLNRTATTPPASAGDLYVAEGQSSTADILLRDGLLRDTWVSLRKPCPVSEIADPKQSLIDTIIEFFREQHMHVDAAQVSEVLDVLIEKNLVQYLQESHCYFPTEKTQRLMDDMYIVFCDNCGASNVKLREMQDSTPSPLFCHRCEEII